MGKLGNRNAEPFRHTEASMQDILQKRFLSDPQYVLFNMFLFRWESDLAFKTRSGYWYEVEVKVSAGDFGRDIPGKGEKHAVLSGRFDTPLKPNRFFYAVPEYLVDKVRDCVPEYAGLVSVPRYGEFCRVVKNAPLLTRDKLSDTELDLTLKLYNNYRTYRDRYLGFSDEKAELKAQVDLLKAEFKAETGRSWKEHLKEVL